MHHSELLPGDIILDKAHTMMALGKGLVVDAWGLNKNKGVAQWAWGSQTSEDRTLKPQYVYRPTRAGLGDLAAEYARAWSTVEAVTLVAPWRNAKSSRYMGERTILEGGKASFSFEGKPILDDRRWGVSVAAQATDAPTFGFDALRRVLKYALRMERGFSLNRGTTCCAFVLSCAQAAALRLEASGDLILIQKVFEDVNLKRAPKLKELPLIDGAKFGAANKFISPLATAQGANPGMLKGEVSPDDYLKHCALVISKNATSSIEEIIGSEIFVDAQFTYSSRLLKRLEEIKPKKIGWVKILHDGVIT